MLSVLSCKVNPPAEPPASETRISPLNLVLPANTAPVDAIRMQWDATSDVVFQTLAGEMEYDYSSFGGLKNTEASGFTGDVNVVLPACTNGDTGTIVCEWIKVYES